MVQIRVREKESIEDALRRFKRKVEKEGIIRKYRDKIFYAKPSTVKRQKLIKAKRKSRIKQNRQNRNKKY